MPALSLYLPHEASSPCPQLQVELLELMEYFGFVVPVPVKPGRDAEYIVPALLPRGMPLQLPPDEPKLVLHFDLAARSASLGDVVLKQEAMQQGFLPEGVVHRLFGVAAGWTYHTAPGFDASLGSDSASVAFGSLQLVLQRTATERFSIRCIIVRNVARSSTGSAFPVAERLLLLVGRVLQSLPHDHVSRVAPAALRSRPLDRPRGPHV